MSTPLVDFARPSSRFIGFRWEPTGPRIGILTLGFMDGAIWHYADVPEALFEDFMLSASRGSHFERNIKPFYIATREIVDKSSTPRDT